LILKLQLTTKLDTSCRFDDLSLKNASLNQCSMQSSVRVCAYREIVECDQMIAGVYKVRDKRGLERANSFPYCSCRQSGTDLFQVGVHAIYFRLTDLGVTFARVLC